MEGFATSNWAPMDFKYSEASCYYEFYIEFAHGNIMQGFSDDMDQTMAFAPVAKKFANYIKSYIGEENGGR